ncbi:phosphonate C-P lyase system protein PhnG [Pseudaminobacter arsenicus]|uniref:Phosphonate C-P lyase system protein PhnG n=1 Tax=Borborobacter arsenicus TaxID=1851146 RepID=A0A432V8A0_9HYPH|nr:phosphonate C-P lyase system protein PhnG [Pseudaminobacter arsenicus]RUM98412.1 phosphonate C-P lyase system protein PhnG [Pseudaminobacter arsenicus]
MQTHEEIALRRSRMSVLARARTSRLQELWAALDLAPSYQALRGPECGLITLQGRIGGGGEAFNFGEATVTRASVRLEDGSVGHAVALGRDMDKARIAALVDAVCRKPEMATLVDARMIAPLQQELDEADETLRQLTAATRVDFFTMVRGED